MGFFANIGKKLRRVLMKKKIGVGRRNGYSIKSYKYKGKDKAELKDIL